MRRIPCPALPLIFAAILLINPCLLRAQIQVTGLRATNTFAAQPPVGQWSTYSYAGGSGSITAANVEGIVQSVAAASINSAIATAAGSPPDAASLAVWAAPGFLQTRPTFNGGTFLMARLQNMSGSVTGLLEIAYDLAVVQPVTEELPAHKVYYSLTGAANSWQNIAALSGGTTGLRSVTLGLPSWGNGALLYLIWVDDNASSSPDAAHQIDNFRAAFSDGNARILEEPVAQFVAPGNPATFSVLAAGATPLHYQWWKDGYSLLHATNASYSIDSVDESHAGSYFVIVSNSLNTVTSSVAVLTVNCDQAPAFTLQPTNHFLAHGGSLQLVASASGTSPLRYQWFRDFAPIPHATASSFTKSFATLADSGDYFVTVSNCLTVVTSSVVKVSVAAAPVTLVGLTNHFWKYDQSGDDLGTAWRESSFNDSAWPAGRGVFALETYSVVTALTNTVLSLTDAQGTSIMTYYFRTKFAFTNDPQSVRIVMTNLIDDGAVYFLNGVEFHRENFSSNPWNAATGADSAANEGVFTQVSVPASLLLPGDNVLAVEVHQVSVGSSDVVFGLSLTAEPLPLGPPQITREPQTTGGWSGGSAQLVVEALSVQAFQWQWFHRGVPLAEQTNAVLAFTNLQVDHSGEYFVSASNSFGSVTSRVAYLSAATGTEQLRLIEFTNQWRFSIDNPPAAWPLLGFNENSWNVGRAVLLHTTLNGFPEATNTILPLTNSSGPVVNYFFRTSFTLPTGVSNLFLVASNLIDDAAIFYVNGEQVSRIRIQTTGNTTTMSSAPSSGRAYDVFMLSATNLTPGENVMAVQVIQISPTSSDIVFGMNLYGYAASPSQPTFVIEPVTQTIPEGQPVSLLPQVFGSVPMHYQWLRDGAVIADATNLALQFLPAHPSHAGNYRLVASNAYGVATGAVVGLSVSADIIPPRILSAFITNGQSSVLVNFSEPVSEVSATNIAHYALSPSVSIVSAQLVAPHQVLLTVTGLDVQNDYALFVQDVTDRADAPNAIEAGAAVRVRLGRIQWATGLLNVETVFVILMQNQPWSNVKGHPDCPTINGLLPLAAYSENYHSPNDQHPSTPNTLWLEAGENFGVEDNRGPNVFRLATTNHFSTLLRDAGIEWRGYIENMPPDGSGTNNAPDYYARQNPFVFFDDVTTDIVYFTNHVRTFDRFLDDLSTGGIGRYNLIVPSLTNSMDFLPAGVSTRQKAGDDFLGGVVPQILQSAAWSNNGALFIVWDEDLITLTEPIGMMLLSPHARAGFASSRYADHSTLLRTLQDIFAVRPYLGAAHGAAPFNELFRDYSLRLASSNGVAGVWLENVRPGRTNFVQVSEDLFQWTTISTNVPTENAVFVVDPNNEVHGQRFYRAIEQP